MTTTTMHVAIYFDVMDMDYNNNGKGCLVSGYEFMGWWMGAFSLHVTFFVAMEMDYNNHVNHVFGGTDFNGHPFCEN